jgi:ABC-2 type transport system ATP-binding protein
VSADRPDAVVVSGLDVIRGGRRVLSQTSAAIPAGLVTGLIGPSGSGKSTLMRAIVGVQKVDGGTVTVHGRPAGGRELRNRVGYLTQAPSVYADLTMRANLRYFARILGVAPETVDSVVERLDLDFLADRYVRTLSGGERSRASLAVALLVDPDLLVLDEPTVGLDPVLRRELWHVFHSLAREGKTVLVSTHVMDEAGRCDELVLMRDGRVLATGAPDALCARTQSDDLEQAFLALAGELP